jgi:flagellar protein FlaH
MSRRPRSGSWLLGRPYSLGLSRHDGLTRAFGGGLPRGGLVLVEGEYGSGKSVLSGRFAHGLCSEGHTTTVLSTERPVGTFLSQMLSLSYDVREAIHRRKLLYLFGDIAGLSRETDDPPELLTRLTNAKRMWECDVAILDSFGDVLRYDPQFERLVESMDRRRATRNVVSFLREIVADGRTVVLTVDPSGLSQDVLDPFRTVADVSLRLERADGGGPARREIVVRRFTGVNKPVDGRIGFSIRAGSGIVIDNRRVVRR